MWVKPCADYDGNIFDRTFDRYIQQHRDKMPVEPNEPVSESPKKTPPPKPSSNLPQIPPRRRSPSTQKPGERQTPAAFQQSEPTFSSDDEKDFRLIPSDFPITLPDVQVSWRLLRQAKQVGVLTVT